MLDLEQQKVLDTFMGKPDKVSAFEGIICGTECGPGHYERAERLLTKWTKAYKSAYNKAYYRTHKEHIIRQQLEYRKDKTNRHRGYTPRKQTADICNDIMARCET